MVPRMSVRPFAALAALVVLLLALPAPAQAVVPTSCETTATQPACVFACDAGDTVLLQVESTGPNRLGSVAAGSAACGTAAPACVGVGTPGYDASCSVAGPTHTPGVGTCQALTPSTVARCAAF